MKLAEWAENQPVKVTRHPKFFNSFFVPDAPGLIRREEAWHLSDYRVTSVQAGVIWFSPRNPITAVELHPPDPPPNVWRKSTRDPERRDY